MRRNSALLIVFLGFCSLTAKSQNDTLRLDLPKAQALFLKNNYDLLVSNYQIEQAKAEIITAKLFDNPELEYENLFYNHETKKFLQTSAEFGQFAGSVSQLFKLAGKRNKNIKLAQAGVKMAEMEYFELMRTLRFELTNNFYKAYYATQSVKVFDEQITSTAQLLKAYELQFKSGNVAQKDLIRIKSLLIGLKAERVEALNDLEDNYRDLKLICGITAATPIEPVVEHNNNLEANIEKFPIAALLDSARANRPDLKLAKTDLQFNEANLSLQKAMAIPDVELALSYDYKGNFPEKYTGIGIKIPIPLFNRNQGEIKKAKLSIDESNLKISRQQILLENEVLNSYRTALRNEKLIDEIDIDFTADFNKLITALIKNFKERNISLIEFLDLYDSYKQNTLQLNKLQFERMSSRAEINYVTGSNIFK
ncbi:TolC family protein [Pedobacter aquatilis]|uniref:TolC family protein n=1 Tax=Pedobacter aquatilis TaxID=351343 RepID=UPI00292E9E5B|nr:TolC family protein [Pedobacter aquatilis]